MWARRRGAYVLTVLILVQAAVHLLKCAWAWLINTPRDQLPAKGGRSSGRSAAVHSDTELPEALPAVLLEHLAVRSPSSPQQPTTASIVAAVAATMAPLLDSAGTARRRGGQKRITADTGASASLVAQRIATMLNTEPGLLLVQHDGRWVPGRAYFSRTVAIAMFLLGFREAADFADTQPAPLMQDDNVERKSVGDDRVRRCSRAWPRGLLLSHDALVHAH